MLLFLILQEGEQLVLWSTEMYMHSLVTEI